MVEFYTKIVGVTFEGRQRAIAGLTVGQALRFVPDPTNPYDNCAVKVITENGIELGFIGKERNSQIFSNLMSNRGQYQVSVSSITGGGFGSNYGCNIKVVYTENSCKPRDKKNDFAIIPDDPWMAKIESLQAEKEELDQQITEKMKGFSQYSEGEKNLKVMELLLLKRRRGEIENLIEIEKMRRQAELDDSKCLSVGYDTLNENKWTERRVTIQSTVDSRPNYLLTLKFYESSYACPLCGRPMYKTVFPMGGEYAIHVSNGKTAYMKRVFTCPECRYFATAAIDKLGDGLVYELQCSSQGEYRQLLNEMNDSGTTQGRTD